MHCRKSLLFDNTDIWTKKKGNKDFDVTIGSFEGAEVCDFLGLYILYILSTKCGKNLNGICRDDGSLQKEMKFPIKDFFSKCAQIRRKLLI